MLPLYQFAVFAFVFIVPVFSADIESKSLKKIVWKRYPYGNCTSEHYMCVNQKCIKRKWLCDGTNDCGDNSDEQYCNVQPHNSYGRCPTHYQFFKCDRKCIPQLWVCDGITDCIDGSDEQKCANTIQAIAGVVNAEQKAKQWLENQVNRNATTDRWGINVPRIAVALCFASTQYFTADNPTGREIRYEISLRLLHALLKKHMNVRQLTSEELAIYLNALLVSCKNPRNFYGVDIVAQLRAQVDRQDNYTNPFTLLALCNAGDIMSQRDVDKLYFISESPLRGWTDMRALALMALSCIAASDDGPQVPRSKLNRLATDLKQKQNTNGSFGTIYTTALVMQALFASTEDETKDWDLVEAVKYLVRSQNTDGSFGNLLNTYHVMPVFKQKSLTDINAKHCDLYSNENNEEIRDELENKGIEKVRVKYSTAFGDAVSVSYYIAIRVPVNSSVFELMKTVAALDSKYSFKYITRNSKPYVYEMGGVQDDPEYGRFWFLCKFNETANIAVPTNLSPVDVIIKEDSEYIMWYRSSQGSLNFNNSTLLT